MLFSGKSRKILFPVFAFLSCLAAIYHVVDVFYKLSESPVWRHCLCVLISLYCAYGILKLFRNFVYLAAILLVRPFYSHGTNLINMLHQKKQVYRVRVSGLLLLPCGMYFR